MRTGCSGKALGHSTTAASMASGQVQTFMGIPVDFPGSLAGEGEGGQAHESGYVFEGIAEEKTDFMREAALGHTRTELPQDRIEIFTGRIAGLVQKSPDRPAFDQGL